MWSRESTDFGSTTEEGPDATEVGINLRIGLYARLWKHWALAGHIGQNLAHTSGKNSIGEISWWSSTHQGNMGLGLEF